MTDEEELFRHEVTPWTAGRLRDSLSGLLADTPLKVNVSEEPRSGSGHEHVAIGAGLGKIIWAGERGEQADPIFGIDCEFPSGDYYQPRHAANPRPGRQTEAGQ